MYLVAFHKSKVVHERGMGNQTQNGLLYMLFNEHIPPLIM
jgi:hypothetical protein